MRFGPVPIGEARGAILAHSLRLADRMLHKGTRIGPEEQQAIAAAGLESIVAAVLEPGDIHEDEAAGLLAAAVAGEGVRAEAPATGRSNLYAETAGLLLIDAEVVNRFNAIDPAITLATLDPYRAVEVGRMVATVKIIPFAVRGERVEAARAVLAGQRPIRIAPFRPRRVGVVSTLLPSLKPSVIDKTLRILNERLAPAGASVIAEERVPHEATAVAEGIGRVKGQGTDLLVIYGASAVVDEADVVPAGIIGAGGVIEHLGMPVDPGNLLVLGRLDDIPVLGAPGCARSPRENGFDWVLHRLLAGLEVSPRDIAAMGVGGLLMEIVTRPSPREPVPEAPAGTPRQVAAIVLAAGQSRRMGGPAKQLARLEGKPLVRIAAEAALASRARPVIVVTGHRAEAVEAALEGLDVQTVRNAAYAEGLSTSLRAGIAAVPPTAEGAIVMLADMPGVSGATVDRLIDAFDPASGSLIVVPTNEGKRGNPVLWSRRFFDALSAITGDVGARHLIGEVPEAVAEVEIGPAVALDLDTPEALSKAGGELVE